VIYAVNPGKDISENEKHKRSGCHRKKQIPFAKNDKDKKWEEGGNTKELKDATHFVRYYGDMLDALHLLIPDMYSSKYSLTFVLKVNDLFLSTIFFNS